MNDDENFHVCLGRIIMNSDLIGRYDKSDPIFHYTSCDGLLGILQKDGPVLWFSQYDSLNDTTEGVHVISIYQCVCDTLFNEGQIDRPFYQAIYNLEPMTTDVFTYSEGPSNTDEQQEEITDWCKRQEAQKYICCFSKNRDSLPMWNYYTKGDKYEGYNIGFCLWRTKQHDVQDYYGKGYKLDFFTVIYEDQEKKRIIQDTIKGLYSFYKDGSKKDALPRIQNILSYFLRDLSLKFKQECFQHEQEVRGILTVPKGSTLFKVKYRSKAGYIIPYIEFAFPSEIISGITVGPLLHDKAAITNIRQFAKDHCYLLNDDDIQASKIPIRY